jgi:hypothetical protein
MDDRGVIEPSLKRSASVATPPSSLVHFDHPKKFIHFFLNFFLNKKFN